METLAAALAEDQARGKGLLLAEEVKARARGKGAPGVGVGHVSRVAHLPAADWEYCHHCCDALSGEPHPVPDHVTNVTVNAGTPGGSSYGARGARPRF